MKGDDQDIVPDRFSSIHLPPELNAEFEQIVRRFEEAWRQGPCPEISPFLPVGNPLRLAVLCELIQVDIEFRTKSQGKWPDPTEYLQRFPELSSNLEFVKQLQRGFPSSDTLQTGRDLDPGNAQPAVGPSVDAGQILGNYAILERIGGGGMGAVFKAQHRRMNRIVALKTISAEALRSPAAVERFRREVQVAARLDHPNIVTAHDADQFGDIHVLVMQYVEGSDLASIVRKTGPLSIQRVVKYLIDAARGLEYAHRRGVIHRDIKPSNLLIDTDDQLKILDMGLARVDETLSGTGASLMDVLTNTGSIMGTVDFMSPEQALDAKQADARSDIYSLGCTLYFLCTGKTIYDGDTAMKRLVAHREAPIPRLRDARPDVPDWLASIFQRMVAKNPLQRFQSVSNLLADLASNAGRDLSPPPGAPGKSASPRPPAADTAKLAAADTDVATTIAPPSAFDTSLPGSSVVEISNESGVNARAGTAASRPAQASVDQRASSDARVRSGLFGALIRGRWPTAPMGGLERRDARSDLPNVRGRWPMALLFLLFFAVVGPVLFIAELRSPPPGPDPVTPTQPDGPTVERPPVGVAVTDPPAPPMDVSIDEAAEAARKAADAIAKRVATQASATKNAQDNPPPPALAFEDGDERRHAKIEFQTVAPEISVTLKHPVTQLLLIFDVSGSMDATIGSGPGARKKIVIAREAIAGILDELQKSGDDYEVALMLYGHRARWNDNSRTTVQYSPLTASLSDVEKKYLFPSNDVELVRALSRLDEGQRYSISASLYTATPHGATPLFLAAKLGLLQFRERQAARAGKTVPNRRVVIITDGDNNPDEDPKDRIRARVMTDAIAGFRIPDKEVDTTAAKVTDLKRQYPELQDVRLDFVGFGNLKEVATMKLIAGAYGGQFYEAATAPALAQRIRMALRQSIPTYTVRRAVASAPTNATATQQAANEKQGSGDTWKPTTWPIPGDDGRYEVTVQGLEKVPPLPLTLFGGEALSLMFDQEISRLRPIGYPVELQLVAVHGMKDRTNVYAAALLSATAQDGTATFRLALSLSDEAEVTPRPRAIWGTIVAQDANRTNLVTIDDKPVTYRFLTADYVSRQPLPVLELKLADWPQAAVRATFDLQFLKPAKSPRTMNLEFVKLRGAEPVAYPEFPGIRFHADVHGAPDEAGWEALVVATYDPEVKWPVTIEPVSPSDARGVHRYYGRRSEHRFHFDQENPGAEEIRFRVRGVDSAKSDTVEIKLPSVVNFRVSEEKSTLLNVVVLDLRTGKEPVRGSLSQLPVVTLAPLAGTPGAPTVTKADPATGMATFRVTPGKYIVSAEIRVEGLLDLVRSIPRTIEVMPEGQIMSDDQPLVGALKLGFAR